MSDTEYREVPDRRQTKPFGVSQVVPAEELRNMTNQELVKLMQDRDGMINAYQDNLKALAQNAENSKLVDALTGLPNLAALESTVARAYTAAQDHIDSTVMFIDADHFKDINDASDHSKGDEIIKKLAQVFKEQVRLGDVVFRRSGDEFAMVLPNTSLDEAMVAAERIRSAVETAHIGVSKATGARADVNTTLSIGVANFYDSSGHLRFKNPHEIIDAADQTMYQAKQPTKDVNGNVIHPGRNRVMAYQPQVQNPDLTTTTLQDLAR